MPSSIKDLMSVMRTSVACLELAYILQRTRLRVTSTSMASVAAQAAPLTKTAPAMCATGTLIHRCNINSSLCVIALDGFLIFLCVDFPQTNGVLPCDIRKVFPAVQRHEDGPRSPWTSFCDRPSQCQRPGLRRVRDLPRRTGTAVKEALLLKIHHCCR